MLDLKGFQNMIAIIDYDVHHSNNNKVKQAFVAVEFIFKLSFTNYLLIQMS